MIPNQVSSDEVAVYKAWLQDFFTRSKLSHKTWYVESETGLYSQETACDKQLIAQGVKAAYIQALRDLGTARYLIPAFDIGFARTFEPYRSPVDLKAPERSFVTYHFSRVAFSGDSSRAFFHVSGVTGPGIGQGGFGEDVLATRDATGWHFRRVGCVAIID